MHSHYFPCSFLLIDFFWYKNSDSKRNLLIRMNKENNNDEEIEEGRNSLVELSEGYLVDPSNPINN